MPRLSPAAKLVAQAFQSLTKDPLCTRVVLRDKKLGITAISYHGDQCDGTIITVLKNDNV